MPISFRNVPVGSTNTIIYIMYKENNIEIEFLVEGQPFNYKIEVK